MHDLTLTIHTAEGPLTYQWCIGGPYIQVTLMGQPHPTQAINVVPDGFDQCPITTIEELVTECEAHADRLMADGGTELYHHLQASLF